MTVAKSQSEQLMHAALPFAEQMLRQHGEFFPYGMAMKIDGQVLSVAAATGNERPTSAELIKLLKIAFVKSAKDGGYKATALIYDVRVQVSSSGAKSDAMPFR